jgi:rhodanese-related sulfurtransferase
MKSLKSLTRAVLLGAAVCAFAQPALAAETPASLAGVTLVSAERAKALADSGVPMVDTRAANEYAEQHVKGAKSVPYREKSAKAADFDAAQDSFDLAKLPADKSAPIVFYCNAGECWKSYKASVVAQRAGYKAIHWMRGGIPEWKSKGLPVE